jgi:DNA-3-methyladenine glycosylase
MPTVKRFDEFDVDPQTLARRLLGQRLVRVHSGRRLAGTIVETEAYLGAEDAAAHTFNGRRTTRNASMYLPGGHAYVYFIYGIHHCLNIVCGKPDEGVAVLLRALAPTEGLHVMYGHRAAARRDADLCSGPAKLTQALCVDRTLDGEDLRTSAELFIEAISGNRLREADVFITSRVGVGYAGPWAQKPLRYGLRDNPHVSVQPK